MESFVMNTEAANTAHLPTVTVSREELPLSCPRQHEEVWDKHPRVFLPIEQTGEAVCPYCSTHYVLQD